MSTTITFRLSEQLKYRLNNKAASEKRSLSNLIVKILEENLGDDHMNTIEKKIKNAILEIENLRFIYPNKDNQYRIEQARLMKIIDIKSRSELDKWIKMWKMEE